MKRTLLIVVATSAIASGVAFTVMPNVQSADPSASARVVPVQYYERSDSRSASIKQREARINQWIERGLNDGRLRPWEARRLQRELGDIEARANAMEADGRLNGREFAQLDRDLDRLADNVRDRMRD